MGRGCSKKKTRNPIPSGSQLAWQAQRRNRHSCDSFSSVNLHKTVQLPVVDPVPTAVHDQFNWNKRNKKKRRDPMKNTLPHTPLFDGTKNWFLFNWLLMNIFIKSRKWAFIPSCWQVTSTQPERREISLKIRREKQKTPSTEDPRTRCNRVLIKF